MDYIYKTNKRGKYLHKLVSGLVKVIDYAGYWIGASTKLPPLKVKPDGCTCTPIYGMGRPGPVAYVKRHCRTHRLDQPSFTEEFLKTYNSFSGIDCSLVIVPHEGIAYIGPKGTTQEEFETYYEAHPRKVCREVQGISFTEYINDEGKSEVEGFIITTFFDEEVLTNEYFDGNHDIVLLFHNEYGRQADIRLSHVKLKTRSTGISVDDLTIDIRYEFMAQSLVFSKTEYGLPISPSALVS